MGRYCFACLSVWRRKFSNNFIYSINNKITAFILFDPYAGVIADRIDRKKIMYITHFVRMGIVAFLPFLTEAWQIYILILFLNIFNAFFTPAYKAAIPQLIKSVNNYISGVGLSNATNQLLGVLGPGLASGVAAWLGARQIFFVDAATFIIAAVFILSLPSLLIERKEKGEMVQSKVWADILKDTRLLFTEKAIRFALLIYLSHCLIQLTSQQEHQNKKF